MLVQINWNPSRREMRQFGWVMLVGFALLGGLVTWVKWKENPGFMPLYMGSGLAVLFWACALFLEKSAGLWLYKAWMGVALVMGTVIGSVLITVLYYGVITPIGFFLRLTGHDPMQHHKPAGESFWHPLAEEVGTENYERQF